MDGEVMNGAEYLIKTVAHAGIEVCFANAGTTEIPIVNALDTACGIRAILCLFEGGCSGAADGYARMKDKPAMNLLHLGPGFANGIANFHNARRAGSPIFNVIGDHATWHRPNDPLLNMDLESLVGTVSGWQRNNKSPENISRDVAEGISAAYAGQIASLIVPSDHQWAQPAATQIFSAGFTFDPVKQTEIEAAAQLLRTNSRTALVLGGRALHQAGLRQAARICAAAGCDLLTDVFPARIERGAGYPIVKKIPYFPEQATAMLAAYETFVFAGAREPVAFFGYEGLPGILLAADQKRVHIGDGNQDEAAALEHLADALGAPVALPPDAPFIASFRRQELPEGALTVENVCLALAALQPENAVIIDESLTSGFAYYNLAATAPPHTLLYLTGGAIGQGIPSATGAAVACPDRPVINFQADGSALYTLQALWTQARENLNVTTLICSNRSYKIIRTELERAGCSTAGPAAEKLIDLNRPDINWVQLSQGFGVPATAAVTVAEFAAAFHRAMVEPGPHLIELVLQM